MSRNYFKLIGLLAVLTAQVAAAQGMLIPADTSMGPLGIKYQRVSAEIQDGAAVTRVDQVFVNSGPRQLEAHFVFPLPKGAALQDPGLLEYIDSDVFRARVFPVPANGEMRIELTFSQVLDAQNGVYRYRYPLGAGTRGAPALKVRQDFTFSASVKSKVPLRSIYSPTHKLGVSNKGENAAIVGLELGAGADISKDLDLYYS
ncbi:MAG: Vault protein, inter-alpha-trypsin domain protein, partial [Myxococcaceae bacterium]|nr:Vault protein, inter-alpha-trypsin domain protein [Myxococcaceae bacterium]